MKRALIAASTSSLLLLSTSAFASELTGFYIGSDFSIAETYSFETTVVSDALGDTVGDSENIAIDDVFGSADVKIGYNFVFGRDLFAGIEANYNIAGIDEVFEETDTERNSLSKEDSYGIRLKLGKAVTTEIAFYGILGYQSTEFNLETDDGEVFNFNNDHTGISYGIGATYAMTPNWLLSAEAMRTDYGSENYIQNTFDVEPSETKFNIGIAYRFDI